MPRVETMWGNVLGHGGYIHSHSHSNSMFSGVWYPEDPPQVSEAHYQIILNLWIQQELNIF